MVPKSVTKINKNGVTFTDSVDRVNYTIKELTRAAMKDVGRFVSYQCSVKVGEIRHMSWIPFSKRRYFGKAYQYNVMKREYGVFVGIHNLKRGKSQNNIWYGEDAELGTNGQPKRAILYNTVKDNIDKIREIEAKYLSYIEDEQKALAAINEDEETGDGEDYKT